MSQNKDFLINLILVYHKLVRITTKKVTTFCAVLEGCGIKSFILTLLFQFTHLLLCKLDLKDAIVRLGNRIECLHVHDNNGLEDQHIAPYTGVMDWKHFMEGLKVIGYNKPMCFETFNIWNKFPKQICPEVMQTICKTGRYFAEQIEM